MAVSPTMMTELIVETLIEFQIQSANGRKGWTCVAMLSSNSLRKLSSVAFGGMRFWLISVFAGLSAALSTQAIGKNAYRMRKPSRSSFNPTSTPRRGATAPERLEVLTDLLQLPREAEGDHRDAGNDQEDEHRDRRR